MISYRLRACIDFSETTTLMPEVRPWFICLPPTTVVPSAVVRPWIASPRALNRSLVHSTLHPSAPRGQEKHDSPKLRASNLVLCLRARSTYKLVLRTKVVSHARWGENVVLDPRPVPASLPIHTYLRPWLLRRAPKVPIVAQRTTLCGQKRKRGEAKNLPTHYSANRNTPFLLRVFR